MQIDSPNILTVLNVSGSGTISGSLNVIGNIQASSITGSFSGTATEALAVDFDNVTNKPSLVSGSSQIQLDEISGNEFVSQSFAFPSNLTIRGNLIVSGSTFIEDTQTIQITDNLLVVNSGEQGEGVTSTIAGIQIDRGTATDFQFVFDENSKDFKIGEVGDLQSVGTRETTPSSAGIPFWNPTQKRFDTSGNAILDSSGNIQANSFTGSLDFSNLENLPTLVSGSEQISFDDISDKPTILKEADVVDNLTSTDTDKPLSANQGKVLEDGKEPADATILKQANIVDNLTSTSTTEPLSANQGKVLEDNKVERATDKSNSDVLYKGENNRVDDGDGSSFIPNFTESPLIEGDKIVEVGSNSDGSFFKYANGMLVCVRPRVSTFDDSIFPISPGANPEKTFTFAHAFTNNDRTTVFSGRPTSSAGGIGRAIIYNADYAGSTSLSQARVRMFNAGSSSIDEIRDFVVTCIGRWK